jgi:hypothetical protein
MDQFGHEGNKDSLALPLKINFFNSSMGLTSLSPVMELCLEELDLSISSWRGAKASLFPDIEFSVFRLKQTPM